jgi:hypothetical protein
MSLFPYEPPMRWMIFGDLATGWSRQITKDVSLYMAPHRKQKTDLFGFNTSELLCVNSSIIMWSRAVHMYNSVVNLVNVKRNNRCCSYQLGGSTNFSVNKGTRQSRTGTDLILCCCCLSKPKGKIGPVRLICDGVSLFAVDHPLKRHIIRIVKL